MSDLAVVIRRRARRRVAGLAGFWAAGVALSGLYAGTGIAITCPFHALTGWDCPLCGATRMGAALLHGQWTAAFMANPMVLIMLVVLAGFSVRVGSTAIGRAATEPSRRGWGLLGRVPAVAWVITSAAISGVFMIARNLT